jgi:hypothetical protein
MITGFQYIGSCNCTGVKNMKYEKEGYIVYYIPKRKIYHIKHGNHYISKNQPILTLCEKLKSLGLTDSNNCLGTN